MNGEQIISSISGECSGTFKLSVSSRFPFSKVRDIGPADEIIYNHSLIVLNLSGLKLDVGFNVLQVFRQHSKYISEWLCPSFPRLMVLDTSVPTFSMSLPHFSLDTYNTSIQNYSRFSFLIDDPTWKFVKVSLHHSVFSRD